MSLAYLLDTDAISEPIRLRPNAALLRRLRAHADKAAIGAPTWHEVLFGVRLMARGARRDGYEAYFFEEILRRFPILPYDSDAAALHADERARLRRAGRHLPFADGQIASIAMANDLVVVTRNTRDFAHFAGVRVENWWT